MNTTILMRKCRGKIYEDPRVYGGFVPQFWHFRILLSKLPLSARPLRILPVHLQPIKQQARRITPDPAAKWIGDHRAPLTPVVPLLPRSIEAAFTLRRAAQVRALLARSRGAGALLRRLSGMDSLCLPIHGQAQATAVIQKTGMQQASAAIPNLPL